VASQGLAFGEFFNHFEAEAKRSQDWQGWHGAVVWMRHIGRWGVIGLLGIVCVGCGGGG
jgi:membrane protein required for beta-lactamase induction